jgi:hypothetical protein
MKRFNATSTMVEEDDGWYVRYVDAADEIEALKKEIKQFQEFIARQARSRNEQETTYCRS